MSRISRRAMMAGALTATAPVLAIPAQPAVYAAAAPDPDAELLSLFRHWQEAQRALQAIAGTADDDTFSAACDACDAMLAEMVGIPAQGAAGWAVKTYAHAHLMYGGTRADYAAIELPDADTEHGTKIAAMVRSLLADAARFGVGGAPHA